MIANKKVVACYIRLSDEDEESAKGRKDESNSVSGQRQIIRNFISSDILLQGYDIKEYVDDGYTGTNFRRPGYENLMDDAKRGEVGVIIVKDFSRLGRDYLETGNLLERIFPLLQIRFISVNDHYDSDDFKGTTGGLNVALKNVLNNMYSRDLSNKVCAAMTTRAKAGQYMAAKVAYGYKKDPEDKHHLIIDEEAASVVRRIFDLVIEGQRKGWIAKYLNDEGIPSPGEYLAKKGIRCNGKYNAEKPRWTPTTISEMLRNEVYIGKLCWNKTNSNLSSGKKMVKNKREDWIVTENAHEAIVSKEIFRIANEKAFTGKKMNSKRVKPCPLVFCAYCGRTLNAPTDGNHINYRCMNGYGTFAEKECMNVRIKGTDLEQTVLANVNMMAELYCEGSKKAAKAVKSGTVSLEEQREQFIGERERIKDLKMRLYLEYRDGGTKEEYLRKKKEAENRLEQVEEIITDYNRRLEKAREDGIQSIKTSDAISEIKGIQTFDKEMLKKVIDRVVVYGAEKIEIIWKPMDEIFGSIAENTGFIEI